MAYTKLKIASAVLATLTLAACSSKAQTVNYIQGNEDQLYQTAVTNLQDADYSKADQVLTQLSLQYPFGEYKNQIAAMQVYDSYKLNNYSLAITQANTYLQSNNSQYADYILLMHALASNDSNRGAFQRIFNLNRAENDLQNVQIAIEDLRTLINNYPTSQYVTYAKKLDSYLEGLVAQHNLEVAKFYNKYNDPVAAYRRAAIVITNFADTQYAIPALHVMQEAVNQMQLSKYQDEIDTLKAKIKTIKPRELLDNEPQMIDIFPPFLMAKKR